MPSIFIVLSDKPLGFYEPVAFASAPPQEEKIAS